MTPTTEAKRLELRSFIDRILEPEEAVQAVIGIGSIATGQMSPDSDIDIVVFLDPMDWYIIPAEFIWKPSDGSYHSIFVEDDELRQEGIVLDCLRLELNKWADLGFDWPEGRKAELSTGWMAYDREGRVKPIVESKTEYTEKLRLERLDEAIIWLDQHLGDARPDRTWSQLGPTVAHDRLQAAYQCLVQALFAYNRRWLPWRNRQLDSLLQLPWLPDNFDDRVLPAANAPNLDYEGYLARVVALRDLFDDLLKRVVDDGLYSTVPISQAFIRSHEEPGYAWNMDDWRSENVGRFLNMVSEVEE
jgi:hypothetical protein